MGTQKSEKNMVEEADGDKMIWRSWEYLFYIIRT